MTTIPAAPAPADAPVTMDDVRTWAAEGLELARTHVEALEPGASRLRDIKLAVGAGTSFYFPFSNTITIGASRVREMPRDAARREVIETTVHESTHHMVRQSIGLPGLVSQSGPGRVGEGVAQAVAGAAMALHGASAEDRAWGERALDPSWQTTPVGELWWKRDVPLSLTMDDLHDGRIAVWEDAGHVHGGIITNAHREMAARIGMQPMAAITLAAMDGIHQLTGMEGWATATVKAAEQLYATEPDTAQGVRDAWRAVKLVLPDATSGAQSPSDAATTSSPGSVATAPSVESTPITVSP